MWDGGLYFRLVTLLSQFMALSPVAACVMCSLVRMTLKQDGRALYAVNVCFSTLEMKTLGFHGIDGHLNQGTYRSLLYPFIYIETENGKAPTSVLLFYCFETVKGLDTLFYFIASQ